MNIFLSYSSADADFAKELIAELRAADLDVVDWTDVVALGDDVVARFSSAIRSSDVHVALVNANNPNVFYELGIAAGAGIPILIAADDGNRIPSDLSSTPYVRLSRDSIRDARTISQRAQDLRIREKQDRPAFDTAEAEIRAAVEDRSKLESIDPMHFESLIEQLFKERGYSVESTPLDRDGGYDLVLNSPSNEKLVIQAKKLSSQGRVSVDSVRRLKHDLRVVGATAGVLVSSSGFTAAAIALAAGSPIILKTIDDLIRPDSLEGLEKHQRD